MASSDDLAERLRATTRFHSLLHLAVCDSTQDVAQAADRPEGDLIVWADEQLAGRGRMNRSWHGAPGQDVEATFRVGGIRVPDPAVLAAALPAAIAASLEPLCGEPVALKWPNDIFHAGRKLAGVLIDAAGNPPDTFILGVGVNVNRAQFPADLRESATSLALICGRTIERHVVLLQIATAIDRAILELTRNQTDRLSAEFRDRLGLVGRRVRIVEAAQETTGQLLALDLQDATLEGHPPFRLARVQRIEIAR